MQFLKYFIDMLFFLKKYYASVKRKRLSYLFLIGLSRQTEKFSVEHCKQCVRRNICINKV